MAEKKLGDQGYGRTYQVEADAGAEDRSLGHEDRPPRGGVPSTREQAQHAYQHLGQELSFLGRAP